MQTLLPAEKTGLEAPPELVREIWSIPTGGRRGLAALVVFLAIAAIAVTWWLVSGEDVEIHDSWMNVPIAESVEVHDSWMNAATGVEIHDSWVNVTP
jgi:hypothetical protein